MITPNKLEKPVVDLLLPRLQDELDASYFYRAASNWCAGMGYTKAAAYFAKESADELTHAKGIEDYLTGWNVIPDLPVIEKPPLKFKSLVDVIEQAYKIEFALYEDYEKTAMDCFKLPDICTFNFLATYTKIQVDSVREYSDFLNQLALINPDNKFELLYFENKYMK